jgi:hypothetical protein
MRRGKPRGEMRRQLTFVTLIVLLVMLVAPVAAAIGPWVQVTSPSDGDAITTKQVTVSGKAGETVETLTLSGEDLVHGEMANIRWVSDDLVYRPRSMFSDQFIGPLDSEKWPTVVDQDNVSIENGALLLSYVYQWPYPASNGTLVESADLDIPAGVDYQASYRMAVGQWSYSGGGGGVSDGSHSAWDSHLATLAFYETGYPASYLRVIAGGQAYHNSTYLDTDYHDYLMTYNARTDDYVCSRDGSELGTYTMETTPSVFWFGHTEDVGYYDTRPTLMVDYVELWATSGEWISDPIDMGQQVLVDGVDMTWTSNHKQSAEVLLQARASSDEENWTDWVAFDGKGDLAEPIEGTYFQLRMRLAIPDVLDTSAHVTVSSIGLRYHHPLVRVEVRTQDTDWTTAEGLYDWTADLLLRENENTVEVRAVDSAGNENLTSLEVVVDTTPPVGTVEVAGDGEYTNDLNVTLLLNATDRYGVEWMDVSHYSDFTKKVRYPYSNRLDWRMSGSEGETFVYVRFVDTHGLLSETSSASIFYDSFPPHGKVVISGNKEYTGSDQVRLTLTYSDNVGVDRVEVSNHADMSDPYLVPEGVTSLTDWRLAEGGDGPRTVYIRVTDLAGNVVIGSDDIVLYYPKSVGSVTIEDGAELTGQTVVRLAIQVPDEAGVRLMQVSNGPDFKGAVWDVVGDVMWILPDGDGEKTVYVRFIDKRDVVSIPVTDTIVLDQTPPEVNVTLNGGHLYTTVVHVTGAVRVEDSSEPVRMWVSMDEEFKGLKPEDFTEGFDFTIPARESDHTVFVQVEDAAGNLGVGSDTVHYATIRPYIGLELPEGDVTQTVPRIPVAVTPVDPYGGIHVQVAFDQRPDESATWLPLSGLVYVDVPGGTMDGVHTIWVRARNAAGLTTEDAVSIDVELDNKEPTLAILRPETGTKLTQLDMDVILEVAVSDSTKVVRLEYTVDGGAPGNISTWTSWTNVTVADWGEHTIQVVAEDEAGNVATSISVFTLVDADSKSTGEGAGLVLVVLLAIVGAAIAVGYYYNRRFMPGLRPATIHEGDGWEHEWDHPELEGCDDQRPPCRLTVSPEDPVYRARAEGKAPVTPEVEDLEGTQLEVVELPGALEPEVKDGDDDWSEF